MKSQLFKVDAAAPSSSITVLSMGARLSGMSYIIAGTASDATSEVAKVQLYRRRYNLDAGNRYEQLELH